MTAFAVMVSHKNLYGGFNTRRYTLVHGFCFFKLVGKKLSCFLWRERVNCHKSQDKIISQVNIGFLMYNA